MTYPGRASWRTSWIGSHTGPLGTGDVRALWRHIARMRRAQGDPAGAERARNAAFAIGSWKPLILRRCQLPGCSVMFQPWGRQKYCSRECWELAVYPVHFECHPGRHACGAWRAVVTDPDPRLTECGNCVRTGAWREAMERTAMNEAASKTEIALQYDNATTIDVIWSDLSLHPSVDEALERKAENEKDWDANERLYGKSQARPTDYRVIERVITERVLWPGEGT